MRLKSPRHTQMQNFGQVLGLAGNLRPEPPSMRFAMRCAREALCS